jgi:hypothetical protein
VKERIYGCDDDYCSEGHRGDGQFLQPDGVVLADGCAAAALGVADLCRDYLLYSEKRAETAKIEDKVQQLKARTRRAALSARIWPPPSRR